MQAKKVVPRIVLLLVVVGVIAAGAYLFVERDVRKDGDILLYGNVDIRQVRLAFFGTGRITKMHVQEGDRVEAGQLVAELDPARYASAVAKAEAEVAAQKEVVAGLVAGSRPEEITEAQARVKSAEAALKDEEQKQRRAKELGEKQYVSEQQLDDADAAVAQARASLEALQQEAALAVKGPRKEEIAAARAQLKAYEAGLDLAQQELADTKLYAPTNGVIQNRVLEPGDMASPESPAYTLALDDPIWVRAYVSEPDLGRVSEGMAAEVSTDSFPDKTHEGRIGFISPTAEFTPKQIETTDLRTRLVYQVRVFVGNPQNELRLGMPATVRIPRKAGSEQGK